MHLATLKDQFADAGIPLHLDADVASFISRGQLRRGVAVSCARCGRPLTGQHSREAGLGPVCAAKLAAGEHDDETDLDPFDRDDMDITARRAGRGRAVFNIPHRHVHHSPTRMEFGYGGSGAADFALNILARFLPFEASDPRAGVVPVARRATSLQLRDGSWVSQAAFDLHQDFKVAFVARLPRAGGTITGDIIRGWIAAQRNGGRA